MQKKIIILMLATVFTLSSPAPVFADAKDDKIAELQKQVKDLQKQVEDLTSKLEKYQNKKESIEDYLLEKGVLSGERTDMAADMVGAISGFKYGDAEIYEYDPSSEEYKELSAGNSISLKDMEGVTIGALAINGNYVLMGNASDDLIKAFKEFNNAK